MTRPPEPDEEQVPMFQEKASAIVGVRLPPSFRLGSAAVFASTRTPIPTQIDDLDWPSEYCRSGWLDEVDREEMARGFLTVLTTYRPTKDDLPAGFESREPEPLLMYFMELGVQILRAGNEPAEQVRRRGDALARMLLGNVGLLPGSLQGGARTSLPTHIRAALLREAGEIAEAVREYEPSGVRKDTFASLLEVVNKDAPATHLARERARRSGKGIGTPAELHALAFPFLTLGEIGEVRSRKRDGSWLFKQRLVAEVGDKTISRWTPGQATGEGETPADLQEWLKSNPLH